ncbi:hypothetical protein FHR81_005591 [Actinoalloteichus hoggarensis]|uniref:Uncharacterized protein n=1 Tax=Actinoalloteichus hoggarensis TaxID=1470176 RepID=A0A221W8M8_9PSEU|nr:DUF397 domain-containing protein [Actinoalloteichus hoggarensis]ASO21946.1 hypothetical protein AHOG_21650 [Actinoalloteichus hoggarensis]MBB5924506.1 hypothetical protein [Actinoalloteichus hoggarensis]
MPSDRFNDWRTSTYTGEGNCVEVAQDATAVGIRDTKNRDGGTLVVGRAAFAGLLGAIKADRLR